MGSWDDSMATSMALGLQDGSCGSKHHIHIWSRRKGKKVGVKGEHHWHFSFYQLYSVRDPIGIRSWILEPAGTEIPISQWSPSRPPSLFYSEHWSPLKKKKKPTFSNVSHFLLSLTPSLVTWPDCLQPKAGGRLNKSKGSQALYQVSVKVSPRTLRWKQQKSQPQILGRLWSGWERSWLRCRSKTRGSCSRWSIFTVSWRICVLRVPNGRMPGPAEGHPPSELEQALKAGAASPYHPGGWPISSKG